jgi:hypothetical protein
MWARAAWSEVSTVWRWRDAVPESTFKKTAGPTVFIRALARAALSSAETAASFDCAGISHVPR